MANAADQDRRLQIHPENSHDSYSSIGTLGMKRFPGEGTPSGASSTHLAQLTRILFLPSLPWLFPRFPGSSRKRQ